MMNPREDLLARINERTIMELSRGRECLIQLQTRLQQPAEDCGVASLDQLMQQILRSFANTISDLSSGGAEEPAQIAGEDDRGWICPDGGKRKAAAGRSRRGCYKRRKTSDSWTTSSERMGDGHAWRKYGQKIIQHFDHPRCYFRCSHKPEGCKATKQVQMIKQNPTLFQTTYFHHHTCKKSLALSAQVDSDPVDRNLISFQENIVPSMKDPSPQSEYFTSNSSPDPLEGLFDLDSVGHEPEWGSLLGSFGEEVVSGIQSVDVGFDRLREMDSFHLDEP